jgi:hypothetical protein
MKSTYKPQIWRKIAQNSSLVNSLDKTIADVTTMYVKVENFGT